MYELAFKYKFDNVSIYFGKAVRCAVFEQNIVGSI